MTKGPRRLVLDQYLDSAAPGVIKNAGRDWKEKADDLQELGEALKQAAVQAELRIGEQTLTGPALRAGMEKSSVSMLAKSEQLRTAGEALRQVGQHITDTRDVRDSIADLGEQPSPYQAPAGTPGVELTSDEIQAQADASQARSDERSAWQTQYEKQEARSLALTREMDTAFLAAIPPMKEIHGQQDPTEPPPDVPSGPGGTYLPGTQAPPPTGGGGDGDGDRGGHVGEGRPENNSGDDDGKDDDKDKPKPTPTTTVITPPPTLVEPPPTHHPLTHTEGPTSTVSGTSQNGVTYQPTGGQVSAPGSVGGSSAGASAAALGAAGGAGGMAAGAIRPGSVSGGAASSSAPVRAIGSTGRAGSASALSRSAGSSAAGRGTGSAGSPASRGAGSAAGRGASTGSTAGRGGGAGGRGGSGSGSRSGGRGSSGPRSAGAGGSRSGRKGEREQTTDRDSLVYDQDWLGDEDVAPGVLD